ncbi:M28 family peptidase [Desulfonema magnum]|uniref:Peptidase, M28 family n=1 Tax=Desulfonema magnum TaxID=45655 RepID=A0A975BN15_9BACT|nr:M28 family peptidase [Desulfonema magnum]QTA88188.1 Peptidase, M28 family [Desulfonema magnum]
MIVKKSSQSDKGEPLTDIYDIISQVSVDYLTYLIEKVSVPRHYIAEKENNKRIALWIKKQFMSYGYEVFFQGRYDNIVAIPPGKSEKPYLIAATHYDTVPRSPGADDNGSGIAVLLTCAKIFSEGGMPKSAMFVIFNREEDGLLGSSDFVERYVKNNEIKISEANVLEMVGYCSYEPGSQKFPDGLPVKLPDTGDFLGIIGNKTSNKITEMLLKHAATYLDDFPVMGLKVYFGLERFFPLLRRSDHSPFWEAGIPALMWTDTAEFRNENYHSSHDTPDTLNYEFMRKVAQLLLIRILTHEKLL